MSLLKMLQTSIGKELTETPSAVTNWLKGKLISAEAGKLAIEFVVRKDMTNPMGLLHGGIVAMIHDDIIGMCVLTLDRTTPYTSINLTVDFLKSSKVNDIIIAETEVIRGGRKIIYLHCSIFKIVAGNRILISKATSNMLQFE